MLKSLFIAKADLIPSHAMESTSEIMASHVEKSSNQCLREFTRAEIVIFTNNFKQEQCWVDERTYVPTAHGTGLAIYVMQKDIQMPELNPSFSDRSFVELELEKFNHPNLIKLLGYCLDRYELYCVFELNPNTRLDRLLFKAPGTTSLPWAARLKIAMGAAQGLSFLHQRKHIAYIQFKTSFILVDKDYNARLSDFIVRNPNLGQYTYPFHNDAFYAAPEWFNYHFLNLEENTTVSQFEDVETQNLVKWDTPLLADEVNLGRIMDRKLQLNDCPPKGAFKFALLVSNCLQRIAEKHPSMEEIIRVLYECYQDESNQ